MRLNSAGFLNKPFNQKVFGYERSFSKRHLAWIETMALQTLRALCCALAFFITGGTAAVACSPFYTVASGDTLSGIAHRQLGSVFALQRLHDANRAEIGDNPNRIFVGQTLRMPCAAATPGTIDWSVMPNPETIAHLIWATNVQILDIRGAKETAKGVLPGSVSVPYSKWRGPKENRGKPPAPERLAQLIGEAGLHLDRPILIVHGRDTPMKTGAAAVVYWNLKSAGADQIAILRGGYKAWHEADLPVASAPVVPQPYIARIAPGWDWRADELTVYGIATGQLEGHLLDARPHKMFAVFDKLGQALETTLPQAANLPASPIMAALRQEADIEDGVETVLKAFSAFDIDGRQDRQVVTFCHTGELGALNWFYASELAGLPNVKLYPESLKGWKAAGGLLFSGETEQRLAAKKD